MTRKKYAPTYDINRAFERVPEFMGLDLTRKRNDLWYGGYYINGQTHQYRRDKLKVTIYQGDIWVHEEGGITQSLATWMVNNGKAANYRDAYQVLECRKRPLEVYKVFDRRVSKASYAPWSAVDAMAQFDLRKCALFRWMCTLFSEDRVREVWKMYNVTTDSRGLAVFWYVDVDDRVCYDKRVKYLEDGHRDKSFGGTREYRTADGFTARPYFGAHLVGDECVNVVESEKSCLLATLAYGGVWLATGGKGNLKDVTNAKLYPDYDAREEWLNRANGKAEVVEWWQGWHECGATSDIGDLIEWEITNKK